MFSKILIANRGEIAVRIIRACKEMGIETVAVYSQPDAAALHVSLADESYCIGPAPAAKSYLNMAAVVAAAQASGCQAIHPGYGLLSENAAFARLCAGQGIKLIGPGADVIEAMGDKQAARHNMLSAGVPVVPGSPGIVADARQAEAVAKSLGYPLLIKASAGGGGRGIRRVDGPDGLEEAFNMACAEAMAAFGDGRVYMEKFCYPIKHVEMQILADSHGNIVCLGERECSIQRRNQKMLEESPSPGVDENLRRRMMEAAVLAARSCGYQNAGTVEFLLTQDKEFYFMEMNTRLQVEHPVTEMVTGIDIVKWQIRVAAGYELEFAQQDIPMRGHAIECRINAEDPMRNFAPCCGKISLLHIPGGPWVRFDTALYQDYAVPPFYDSMIGKLIVHAHTRAEAIRKMQAALCELVVEGVGHNRELLVDVVADPLFQSGGYTTDFLVKQGFIKG